jgi:hypothetical protein
MAGTLSNGLRAAALVLLFGCASPQQQYDASIHSAAVRDPGFSVPLRPIDGGLATVEVATFTEWGVPASPLQRYTWVSLPAQLAELCRGKPDPVLAIQQILGLPPAAMPSRPDHQWQVVRFSVPRAAIFRPCPGGTDIAAPRCSAGTVAPGLDDATARFFLDQIWSSNRTGFTRADGGPDYGYPYTGMGWSYDWDPASGSHIGVSEYVLKPGAPIANVAVTTPGAFCNGPVP